MAVALFLLFAVPQTAAAPISPPVSLETGVDLPHTETFDLKWEIARSSYKWGVSGILMAQIIQCESSGNVAAIGDGGTSYGLVQIHLPAHPSVTKEQALDPVWAINFLARELSKGNGRIWTCYRLLKQAQAP